MSFIYLVVLFLSTGRAVAAPGIPTLFQHLSGSRDWPRADGTCIIYLLLAPQSALSPILSWDFWTLGRGRICQGGLGFQESRGTAPAGFGFSKSSSRPSRCRKPLGALAGWDHQYTRRFRA